MATAAAVGGGGARGCRRDWRLRSRCLAGGADDDCNDGNESNAQCCRDWRVRSRCLAGGADNDCNDGDKSDAQCRRDWGVRSRSLAGGADDDCDEGNESNAQVVVQFEEAIAHRGGVSCYANLYGSCNLIRTHTIHFSEVDFNMPGSLSIRRVTVLLPPRAPPLNGDGDSGGGRRGWRKGLLSRLARAVSVLGGRRRR